MVIHEETDVLQLWRDYKHEPTVELRNQLVERYLPLVKYNAERIWSRLPEGVELDDLISAGVFGLMDAIDAFDLERGVKFETYCVPRIRGAMLDELRTMDWVPRLVRSKASKMEEARKALEVELGRFQVGFRRSNIRIGLGERRHSFLKLLRARNVTLTQFPLAVRLLAGTQLRGLGAAQCGLGAVDLHFEGLRIDPVEHVALVHEAALREDPLDHDRRSNITTKTSRSSSWSLRSS